MEDSAQTLYLWLNQLAKTVNSSTKDSVPMVENAVTRQSGYTHAVPPHPK